MYIPVYYTLGVNYKISSWGGRGGGRPFDDHVGHICLLTTIVVMVVKFRKKGLTAL